MRSDFVYTFWESVIEPLFRSKKPRSILEIGAGHGFNTHRMLEYCKQADAHLFVIEPTSFPAWDYLKQQYGSRLHHIRDYSLDALPHLNPFDVVLIDGDHNWYTVYNELKAIERISLSSGRFPLVLLHDTEWPYGRRDMYYFPATIPEPFRQPSARKGMEPGNPNLLEAGGLNDIVHNALAEFGPRNGVRTAIEDFMKETPFSLSFHNLAVQHGLGILSAEGPDFDKLIQILVNPK
jgi:hypothetical protein